MSKILITGGTGFVGQHLYRYLSSDPLNKVFISSRYSSINSEVITLDLRFFNNSRILFKQTKFDIIFHLSSQTSVHRSFKKPFQTMEENILSTLNLLKIIHEVSPDTKLIIAGTSEIYKTSNNAMTESSEIDPRSPYTISKLALDYFIRLMAEPMNINCTILRLFNHTGAGQKIEFVLSNFANQLAKIKFGLQEPVIKVGNISVSRDFTDVRDVIRAYKIVSDKKEYGEVYNVCSGTAYLISDLLNKLIAISCVKVDVEIDKSRIRELDVQYYYGNYDKIFKTYGWKPEIPIEKTLTDLFEWWMKELSGENK